ncbi:MAG: hypothetical protein LPK03_13310 [Pontibacter sp.]|mgnify:CR=1 FL=1|nr:hypothetical protein [Pontibacter sp.]
MRKLAVVALLSLATFFLYRLFHLSTSSIAGLYINNNTTPVLEGPGVAVDTLTINDDLTFENSAWGKGTYKLDGDRITFSYRYEYGTASYSTTINRPLFGRTVRIELDSDLAYFYERIK